MSDTEEEDLDALIAEEESIREDQARAAAEEYSAAEEVEQAAKRQRTGDGAASSSAMCTRAAVPRRFSPGPYVSPSSLCSHASSRTRSAAW